MSVFFFYFVSQKKLRRYCYFYETLVNGWFRYKSAVNESKFLAFVKNGKANHPFQPNIDLQCLDFQKTPINRTLPPNDLCDQSKVIPKPGQLKVKYYYRVDEMFIPKQRPKLQKEQKQKQQQNPQRHQRHHQLELQKHLQQQLAHRKEQDEQEKQRLEEHTPIVLQIRNRSRNGPPAIPLPKTKNTTYQQQQKPHQQQQQQQQHQKKPAQIAVTDHQRWWNVEGTKKKKTPLGAPMGKKFRHKHKKSEGLESV